MLLYWRMVISSHLLSYHLFMYASLVVMLSTAVCAEITQGVIFSLSSCVAWMKSTFFYIR